MSQSRTHEIIAEHCGEDFMEKYGHDTLDNDLELEDGLGLDSLDCVELVFSFEDEYGIEISDKDAEAWKTVDDVIKYIERRLK